MPLVFGHSSDNHFAMMKLIRWIPALLWTGLIAFLTLIPHIGITPPAWIDRLHPDKIVHFILFSVLCLLILVGFGAAAYQSGRSIPLLIFILIPAYGALIEVAQGLFTVTRHPEFMDFVVDTMGVLAGWLTFLLLTRKKRLSA